MEMFNINEAFQQLKMLNEESFSLSDKKDLESAEDFLEKDNVDDTIEIIDLDATTEEELKDSYVGNVILDCVICHSKIYKNKDEIVLSDDGQYANEDEECPYCYSNDGFKIIGEIAKFVPQSDETDDSNEQSEDDDKVEVEVDGEDIEVEEPEDVNESLTEDRHELARRIRRNDFNYDSDIDAKYAEDDDTYIQLQDRETHEHRMGVNGRPKVSSHTWGRVWKDGNYEKSFEGPKYAVRKDMAKYLDDDAINEAADSDKKLFVEYKIYVDGRLYETSHTKERADEITKILTNTYPYAEIVAKPYRHYESGIARKRLEQIIAKQKAEYGINESFEKVNIETEDDIMEMSSDKNGKVTVTTQPKEDVIAPIDPETTEEIIDMNLDRSAEGEPEEAADDVNYDIDEFDEESFDELGESYMKKVYENVNSFKTSKVSQVNNSIVVEGIVTFKGNKPKNTSFVFEAYDAKHNGRVRFVGINENITNNKKSFVLSGKILDKKFVSESLNYNYNINGARVCGTIMNEAKDLSKVDGSMTKVLSDNSDTLASFYDKNKTELIDYVKKLFADNQINTTASNRLINNMTKARNTAAAYAIVYNSILAGSNMRVKDN